MEKEKLDNKMRTLVLITMLVTGICTLMKMIPTENENMTFQLIALFMSLDSIRYACKKLYTVLSFAVLVIMISFFFKVENIKLMETMVNVGVLLVTLLLIAVEICDSRNR